MNVVKLLNRAAALALLGLVLAAPFVLIIDPLMKAYATVDEEIVVVKDQILRANAIAQERLVVEQQLAAFENSTIAFPYHLPGDTDSLAAASLQSRIQQLATNYTIQVRSIQVLPVEEGSGFNRIGVRAEVLGSTDSLVRLIYDVETGMPYLFVDTIDVQGPVEVRNGSRPQNEPILTMTLNVSGYKYSPGP